MGKSIPDRHIVVIGASSGMGQAIARKLLQAGCRVSLGARRSRKLAALAELGAERCFYDYVDVTSFETVQAFITRAEAHAGTTDVVINCAGVMYYQCMHKVNQHEWRRMVDTNIHGFLNLTGAVMASLIRAKGIYINITSDAGRQAFPGLAVYSGTKAFMEYTLRGMRAELAESGVRLLNLQPGNVATPLQNASSDAEAVQHYASHDTANFLAPENIADAVWYALQQPDHVAVNEMLIQPQSEPF